MQTNHYYPFGMEFSEEDQQTRSEQPYKFGGKEEQVQHGLNFYDFHARQYDPALGRFTSVDPKAEKYYDFAPYLYCGNNPIVYIDPNGEERYKVEASLSLNTGFIGASFKILGVGLKYRGAPFGGADNQINVYVMYDSDKKKLGVGASYNFTDVASSNEFTLGVIQTSESKVKEEISDVNTIDGFTSTKETRYKTKTGDGLGPLTVYDDGKKEASTGISADILFLGIEAMVKLSIEKEKMSLEEEERKKQEEK